MAHPTQIEWLTGLAAVQAILMLLPGASALMVLARYSLWFLLGANFLYWVGQAGMHVGHAMGLAMHAP